MIVSYCTCVRSVWLRVHCCRHQPAVQTSRFISAVSFLTTWVTWPGRRGPYLQQLFALVYSVMQNSPFVRRCACMPVCGGTTSLVVPLTIRTIDRSYQGPFVPLTIWNTYLVWFFRFFVCMKIRIILYSLRIFTTRSHYNSNLTAVTTFQSYMDEEVYNDNKVYKWYEQSMVRIVNGTKGLWDEWSMVRMVYTWYE